MSESTYISDQEFAGLVAGVGVKSTEPYEDSDVDTVSELGNGGKVVEHRDLSKPLGNEYFAPAEQPEAEPPATPAEAAEAAPVAPAAPATPESQEAPLAPEAPAADPAPAPEATPEPAPIVEAAPEAPAAS